MRLPATRTLAKAAIYGGVICISTVMYARSTLEDRVRQSAHFRAAMKTLRTHHGAVQLLGEPIKEKGFDLGDATRNFCTDRLAQFEVKVAGPKDRGTMFFWAERADAAAAAGAETERCDHATLDDGGWRIQRLELEVNSIADRRLVVLRRGAAAAAATAGGDEQQVIGGGTPQPQALVA